MNKKILTILGIIVIVIIVPIALFYYSNNKKSESTELSSAQKQEELAKNDKTVTKTYSGILPCADCEGIETSLSLSQEDISVAEGNFSKSQTYIGRDADALVDKGEWGTQKGDASNPDATVIALNPGDPQKVELYLQVDPEHLEMLDSDGNRIQASGGANFTLTLQK